MEAQLSGVDPCDLQYRTAGFFHSLYEAWLNKFHANKMSRRSGISTGFTRSSVTNTEFFYYTGQTQFRRQPILKKGPAYSKVRTHTFEVFYIQNFNTCEGSQYCIHSVHKAVKSRHLFQPGIGVRIPFITWGMRWQHDYCITGAIMYKSGPYVVCLIHIGPLAAGVYTVLSTTSSTPYLIT